MKKIIVVAIFTLSANVIFAQDKNTNSSGLTEKERIETMKYLEQAKVQPVAVQPTEAEKLAAEKRQNVAAQEALKASEKGNSGNVPPKIEGNPGQLNLQGTKAK